jgi:hypothetical protein
VTHLGFFGAATVELTGPREQVGAVRDLWRPFATEPDGTSALRSLAVRDPAVASAELNRTAVEACPYPAVHAAVAGWRGGAIAAPATSGAGKSTLVTALCLAGASYVSDEALVMTADGHARPYPKPVALSLASLAALGLEPTGPAGESPDGEREHLIAAADLGRVQPASLPVRHVVLATRDAGAEAVTLEPAPRREALSALLQLGFNHYRDPPGFLTAAAAVVEGSSTWRLRYGDVRRAARLMADVLP